MKNAVTNASGLDGITGWAGAGLAVDALVRGADGRIAITATGQLDTAAAYEIDVTAGDLVEVFGLIWASAGVASLSARFHAPGGAFSTAQAVPVVAAGSGTGKRGLRDNFDLAYWKGPAPITGTLRIRLASSNGGATVALVKPFVDPDAGPGEPSAWTVGPHVSPDLDLPLWPESLSGPLASYRATPSAMRGGFGTDSGVPLTHITNPSPWQRADYPMVLTHEQRDDLETFWLAQEEPFWIVRPGHDQLVRGRWAVDGEPMDEYPALGIVHTTVGLMLEPA